MGPKNCYCAAYGRLCQWRNKGKIVRIISKALLWSDPFVYESSETFYLTFSIGIVGTPHDLIDFKHRFRLLVRMACHNLNV